MIKKDDLIKLYTEEEKTLAEIGNIYGCDKNNVSYYLKKYNIPRRSRKESQARLRKTNLTADAIKEMVDKGMLISEIAENYNVSRGVINKIAREKGYSFRNHKTARKKQSDFMRNNNPFNDQQIKHSAISNSIFTKREIAKERLKHYSVFDEKMPLKVYTKKARHIAYQTYGKGKFIENGKVIDHMYSISDGYKNSVPISVISNPNNLRLITPKENLTKGSESIITLEKLYEDVVFND